MLLESHSGEDYQLFGLSGFSPGTPIERVKQELHLKEIIKLASNKTSIGPSP